MSSRLIKKPINAFSTTDITYAEDDNVSSNVIDCRDFRNIAVTLIADDSYDGTVKVYGSYSDTAPDLGAVASASNPYFTVEMKARVNDASVSGDTGVVYNGSLDGVTGYGVNDDMIQWIGFKTSSRTAGSVVVQVTASTNE